MTLAVTPGTGATMLTDDIAGVKSAVAKIQIGAAGVDGGLISVTNGLPTNLAQVGASAISLGSAVGASSIPVVLASDQSAIPTLSPVPSINTSSTYAHTASTTAYAYGQAWLNNATAGSVTFPTITAAKANNQAVTITGGRLTKSGNSTTNAIYRVHLFSASPGTSGIGDYGTFQAGIALTNWVGSLDFTLNEGGSDISIGAGQISNGAVICTTPVSGAQTLYWVPEVRAAYTPLSAETLTLTLFVQ